LRPGDFLALADGRNGELYGVEIEDAPDKEVFTTYNLSVEDFRTYYVGEHGVWVHNAAPRNCSRAFSFYRRMRDKNQLTPQQAFARLEQNLQANLATRNKTLADSLEEVLQKDLSIDINSVWTSRKSATAAENAYVKHWLKHKGEFPDIDNAVTYIQRAMDFAGQGTSSGALKVGYRVRQGALEKVVCNLDTREFAVKIVDGSNAGKIKTYFKITDEGLAQRGLNSPLEYFETNVTLF
jgi:hypothetical protein